MRGITTISHIKRYVARLPQGQMFSTREVIRYGKRSAVDKAIGRLVTAGIIIRIVRGIFVRASFGFSPKFTPLDVARIKAKAFGKIIAMHGMQAARKLGLIDTDMETGVPPNYGHKRTFVFSSSGCSSAFKYGDITIKLRKISERKMFGQDSKVGLVIRALWYLGKDKCSAEDARIATSNFYRNDKQIIRQSLALMPSWLSDLFV